MIKVDQWAEHPQTGNVFLQGACNPLQCWHDHYRCEGLEEKPEQIVSQNLETFPFPLTVTKLVRWTTQQQDLPPCLDWAYVDQPSPVVLTHTWRYMMQQVCWIRACLGLCCLSCMGERQDMYACNKQMWNQIEVCMWEEAIESGNDLAGCVVVSWSVWAYCGEFLPLWIQKTP